MAKKDEIEENDSMSDDEEDEDEQPVIPAKVAKVSKPVKPAKSVKPVKPVEPAKAAKNTKKPAKPAQKNAHQNDSIDDEGNEIKIINCFQSCKLIHCISCRRQKNHRQNSWKRNESQGGRSPNETRRQNRRSIHIVKSRYVFRRKFAWVSNVNVIDFPFL